MKCILYFLLGIITLSTSCTQDTTNVESLSSNNGQADGISIEEAKSFFEAQSQLATRNEDPKETFFEIGDYTPLWDANEFSHNSATTSLDIPIIPQYKYKALGSMTVNGQTRPYTVEVTQKLIIAKSRTTNQLSQYIITLIPEALYYDKHKNSIGTGFISRGEKNRFSGLAIYSIPQVAIPLKIEKYIDGKKIAGVTVPGRATSPGASVNEIQKLLENMRFAKGSSAQTRSGEDDGWWDSDFSDFVDWFENNVFDNANHGDTFTMYEDQDGNLYLEDQDGRRYDVPGDCFEDDYANWGPMLIFQITAGMMWDFYPNLL